MSDEHHVGRVRDIFDAWADQGRAEGMESGHGFAARKGFDHLNLGAGDTYVDVGCGNGYTVRWASEIVGADGQAIGLDVSSRMIARAQAASSAHSNVAFHQSIFPVHPLAAGSADAVFSMEVLYYLPHVDAGLSAITALLKPGGRFACVVDYYLENPASHAWPEDLNCPMNLLSMKAWRAAFEAAGMTVLEQTCLQHPLAPGEASSWKHEQGSLMTIGERPAR